MVIKSCPLLMKDTETCVGSSLASYFVFISLISFRFVSFLLISFRFVFVDFVSFRFVSFLFRFALYRYPFFNVALRLTIMHGFITLQMYLGLNVPSIGFTESHMFSLHFFNVPV